MVAVGGGALAPIAALNGLAERHPAARRRNKLEKHPAGDTRSELPDGAARV